MKISDLLVKVLEVQDAPRFESLLARGTRPAKAALAAGVACNVSTLNVMAGLRLAVTADEINLAYGTQVKSCCQGKAVGAWFAQAGIAVLWTPMFRVLVDHNLALLGRGYGFHTEQGIARLKAAGLTTVSTFEACQRWPLGGIALEEGQEYPYLDWWGEWATLAGTRREYLEPEEYYWEDGLKEAEMALEAARSCELDRLAVLDVDRDVSSDEEPEQLSQEEWETERDFRRLEEFILECRSR